jgi:dTDP-glucose pyrophosphorylase
MNIIITLAGHSRRFMKAGYTKPKFLLNVGDIPMIEHVLNMFDLTDKFFFVVNTQQVQDYPYLIKYLNSLAPRVDITVIAPHEKGPAYSAIQVNSIPDGEPLIISYCDFLVSWDYNQFKNAVSHYDAGIPYFKGFHPASFGTTKFAYMKLNERSELIQLKEKESFTQQKQNEPASVGIYYFKSFEFFEIYTNKLMNSNDNTLPEAYVSLLSNLIIHDRGNVIATPVKNFICLGTPSDVQQFNYWYNYRKIKIKNYQKSNNSKSENIKSTNLIPMAGNGSRFRQAQYNTSKPLIGIYDKLMIEYATESIPDADNWVYVCLKKDLEIHSLEEKLISLKTNTTVISLDEPTNGQATTCLQAKDKIRYDVPLLIASCDYEAVYDDNNWEKVINDDEADIIIWTIKLGGNLIKDPKAFAYCEVNENNKRVNKVIEKDTISNDPGNDNLVIGSFWFRTAKSFFELAEISHSKNYNVNGEIYIGNSINQAIEAGKIVKFFPIEHWISFGDPWELDLFYYWMNFFDEYSINFQQ